MPRQYKRKTDNGQFQPDFLEKAVQRVMDGEAAARVSNETGIPRTTLRRKVEQVKNDGDCDISTNFRKSQVFTEEQETALKEYLLQCTSMFYGLTTKAARQLAYETAVVNGIKHPSTWTEQKMAGREWLMAFMRRHPTLSIRTPEATSLARATAFNRYNINKFFNLLHERFLTLKVEGRQIYNLDETGFTTVQGMPKVIASKGLKQVGQMTSRERGELVTVCGIVSATGAALPPVFVFPRKRFQPHMMNNAPEGSLGLVSDNGWMRSDKFLSVLEHFVKHAQPTENKPVVLILDNHESHLSLPALEYAKSKHIHIITLVPHTSNKTQPLDRTVFGPVKKFYNDAATTWMMSHPGQTLTIYNIASLVNDAWLRGATPANIVSGFKAAGIWPFDRNVFPDEYFAPSDVTDRPEPPNTDVPAARPSSESQPSTSSPTLAQDEAAPGGSSVASETGEKECDTPKHPAQQKGSPSPFTSPAQFKGFPKAPPRTGNGHGRGRKRGTCLLATSSPNLKQKRVDLEAKGNSSKLKKKIMFADDSDEDITIEETLVDNCSDSSESESEEVNVLKLGSVSDVTVGEFVVCEYGVKKSSVCYVGIVTKEADEEGDIEVDFFRKSDKVQGKFIRPDVSEIVSVPLSQVKAKLTRAQVSGTTKRTQNAFFFKENLSGLNMN